MASKFSFRAHAHWKKACGSVEADSVNRIEFSAPPEFGGKDGYWTPETFFLAAVASCFVTTFRAIAQISKFEPVFLAVAAEGMVEKGEGGYAFTEVVLKPQLTIKQSDDPQRAMRLLEKTEHSCLVSRSIKAAVRMEAQIHVAEQKLADVA